MKKRLKFYRENNRLETRYFLAINVLIKGVCLDEIGNGAVINSSGKVVKKVKEDNIVKCKERIKDEMLRLGVSFAKEFRGLNKE